ncbi:MAG: diacylglycerol kinase, partial [Oscillospiraceae bacterium]|nr:diacylglycerol kinase [Oscillospiraceae bacterium]
GVFITAFWFRYVFKKWEYVLVGLTFSTVILAELVNTAIEAAVDLCSPEKNKLAKIAKDAAAGAVLAAAVFAVAVGVLLFGDIEVIKEIFRYYGSHITALVGLVCSFGAAWTFVFGLPKDKLR